MPRSQAERRSSPRRRGGRAARSRPGWWRSGCRAASSSRRWSVSKLVSPRCAITAFVAQRGELDASRRDSPGARTSTSGTAAGRCGSTPQPVERCGRRRRERPRGVIGAGRGAPLGEGAHGRGPAGACSSVPAISSADCRSGRPCRRCRSPPSRSRPASAAPAVGIERPRRSRSMSATCHRPVTTRGISRPGASSVRSGAHGDRALTSAACACTACTSSIDIWPTVATSPLVMRHVRNGPTMSPFLSNCTAPITPT